MAVSDFLSLIWIPDAFLCFGFHTSFRGNDRTSAVPVTYLSSTSPSSLTGGRHYTLTVTVITVLPAVNTNTSASSDLIILSQLNHFTFVSALLLPVLRLSLTLPLRLQGLGTGGWLDLTWQDFPAVLLSAYQGLQGFLCPPGEISYADFTARPAFTLYHGRKTLPSNSPVLSSTFLST